MNKLCFSYLVYARTVWIESPCSLSTLMAWWTTGWSPELWSCSCLRACPGLLRALVPGQVDSRRAAPGRELFAVVFNARNRTTSQLRARRGQFSTTWRSGPWEFDDIAGKAGRVGAVGSYGRVCACGGIFGQEERTREESARAQRLHLPAAR